MEARSTYVTKDMADMEVVLVQSTPLVEIDTGIEVDTITARFPSLTFFQLGAKH